MKTVHLLGTIICLLTVFSPGTRSDAAKLTGVVVDAEEEQASPGQAAPLPCRVYLQNAAGDWLFVKSADPAGSALPYRERWVPLEGSVELHTTISAHPFQIDLSPGRYQLTVERGKEYLPLNLTIDMGTEPQVLRLPLTRWVNLAERGWYSGETHVHRRIPELANVQLAEDLNVAFPVTFWTINAFEAPGLEPSPLRRQGPSPFGPRQDVGEKMVAIDATHVFYPRNTEYEVFSVNGQRHVLGAIFILNHRTVFQEGMPPVAEIAARAHAEGALLDLDKHNWPWSMMLVPIAKVDLFELANNSLWRTRFGFRNTNTRPADYMQIETDDRGLLTEWGWIDFGFQNYYTLLNCGFRLTPTAGTASGVHPVPLGFGRVYVHLGDGFDGSAWIEGLRRGRSFVTTGPMLFVTVADQLPGHVFVEAQSKPVTRSVAGECLSAGPLDRVEIVVNGTVVHAIPAKNAQLANGSYRTDFKHSVGLDESAWICVRAIQKLPQARIRFAHTAPWHVEIGGRPVRPRAAEVDFLVRRVEDEIARNKDILPAEAMEEYQRALQIYRRIGRRARMESD